MSVRRRHSLAVVTASALIATLASPGTGGAARADDADMSCRGMPATLMGTPGEDLIGTEGDDVIVSNGASTVQALGGADSICVTRSTRRVDAGAGDDVVISSTTAKSLTTSLGAGSDTFIGNAAEDAVFADDASEGGSGPLGSDVVSTAGGPDFVEVGLRPNSGRENEDTISLGRGDDRISVLGVMVEVKGGPGGDDTLALAGQRAKKLVLSVPAGTLVRDDVRTEGLQGVEEFDVRGIAYGSLEFRGGPRAESLVLARNDGRTKGDGRVTARMGGGADSVIARSEDVGLIVGGAGQDELTVRGMFTTSKAQRFFADMSTSSYGFNGKRSVRFRGFSSLNVRDVTRARVSGNAKRNKLFVTGCLNRVYGKGGRDQIRGALFRSCERRPLGFSAFGGGGNDTLIGTFGGDRLIGGGGRDRARGGEGTDTCRAEVRRSCER